MFSVAIAGGTSNTHARRNTLARLHIAQKQRQKNAPGASKAEGHRSMPSSNLRRFRAGATASVQGGSVLQRHIAVSQVRGGPLGEKLSLSNVNPKVVAAEYAVRGEIVLKAENIKKQLASGHHNYPFNEVLLCNVGNPQALGQKPITFFREVLSLVTLPALLDSKDSEKLFQPDAIKTAREYVKLLPGGSSGAYSHSMGIIGIREKVAKFIEERDGYASDPEKIFLTNGASAAVQMSLQLLIGGAQDGIMVPIPQYPLYSATIALNGGTQVNYSLSESKGWGTSIEDLQRSYDEAVSKGVKVRGLVVINPGNPTGQCLEESNMVQILKFCEERNIVLLADEVYQSNVYSTTPFNSFKKVMLDNGLNAPLISFHSVSKGFVGECGRRGGYMEVWNLDPQVQMQLYKLASVILSPNVDGQIMTGLMVDPPKKSEASYSQYKQEGSQILGSLATRANRLVDALNSLEGVSCNPVEGALYAFPSIKLPPGAMQAAKRLGKSPDTYYCLRLLEETGVVVVPGSGFGQEEGTFHFRTTIVPPLDKIEEVAERMEVFHKKFLEDHSQLRSRL